MIEDYILCRIEITDELINIIIDVKINMAFSLCIFLSLFSIMITEKRQITLKKFSDMCFILTENHEVLK